MDTFSSLVKAFLSDRQEQNWYHFSIDFKNALIEHGHTCDSTSGSRKILFIKPVCRCTIPVDQTTLFENFRKYYENPIKSVPILLFGHVPV